MQKHTEKQSWIPAAWQELTYCQEERTTLSIQRVTAEGYHRFTFLFKRSFAHFRHIRNNLTTFGQTDVKSFQPYHKPEMFREWSRLHSDSAGLPHNFWLRPAPIIRSPGSHDIFLYRFLCKGASWLSQRPNNTVNCYYRPLCNKWKHVIKPHRHVFSDSINLEHKRRHMSLLFSLKFQWLQNIHLIV